MKSTLALGMTTCPRGDECYLHAAILSLVNAGFCQDIHLFCEPGAEETPGWPQVIRHEHEETLGAFRNWRFALRYLLDNTDADWVMIVQDDTIWTDDAADILQEAMDTVESHTVGFLSPYASPAMVAKRYKTSGGDAPLRENITPQWIDAWHGNRTSAMYTQTFWGALALCIPRRSATRLLRAPRFVNHVHHRQIDVVVGESFRDANLSRKLYIPSLCDHIGAISSLGRHKIPSIAWGRKGVGFKGKA